MQTTFWGVVLSVGGFVVSAPVGLAKGAYDVVKAGTLDGALDRFSEGVVSVADPVIDACEKFGNEHSESITKGLIKGASVVLGGELAKAGANVLDL